MILGDPNQGHRERKGGKREKGGGGGNLKSSFLRRVPSRSAAGYRSLWKNQWEGVGAAALLHSSRSYNTAACCILARARVLCIYARVLHTH